MVRQIFEDVGTYKPSTEEIAKSPAQTDLRQPDDRTEEKVYSVAQELVWRSMSPDSRMKVIQMIFRLHPASRKQVEGVTGKLIRAEELSSFRKISFAAAEFRDHHLCWAFDGEVYTAERYTRSARESALERARLSKLI